MHEAGTAGLRTFFRIADRWKLTDYEQARILGLNVIPELDTLRSGGAPQLQAATLERLSYVFGIYQAINTLLPIPARADNWIRAANSAAIFGGRAPIDRMAGGSVTDLQAVRHYLDAQLV